MRKILLTLLSLIFTTNVYCAGNDILPRQYSVETAGQTVDSVSWNTLFYVPSYAVTKGIEYYIKDSEGKVLFAAAYNESAKSHSGKVSLNDIHSACDAAKLTYKSDKAYNSVNNPQSDKNGVCMQMMSYFITQAQTYKDGVNLAHKGTPLTQEECQKVCMNSVGDNKCYWLQNAVTGNDAVKDKKGFCVGADGVGINFYPSCTGERKDNAGQCIKTFEGTQVQETQGIGLIYAWGKKHGLKLTCLPHNKGDDQQDYIECTANGQAYEFEFDDLEEPLDDKIQSNVRKAICKIHDLEYKDSEQILLASSKIHEYCETTDETICEQINESAQEVNYRMEIRTGNFPGSGYCMFFDNVIIYNKNQLQTYYGIENDVFYNGIQTKFAANLQDTIKQYVINKVSPEVITTFTCEKNTQSIPSIKGKDDNDDVVICYANGHRIDFVFDDLSEAWDIYAESGREAMSCITWGGTFTGKKCIGLDEQQCNIVKQTNAQSCPECKLIKWNKETQTCDLPSSESATNLKRGLTYSAIVGGAIINVVITIGTMGTATAPTTLIITGLAVETLGAVIELKAQMDIYATSDEFFTKSASCNDADCAANLIIEYLEKMSSQQNDMLEEELSAADSELARLAELIPAESDFYKNMFANGTDLASNETGEWTAEQIWRAVGVGLQLTTSIVGVGEWVIKNSSTLQKTLRQTTFILRNAKKVALANAVDYDKLDDIGKEWYKLWKQYAPNNQTFDEFKAMTNGDLNEMKQMVKNWEGLGKGAAYSTYDPKMSQAFPKIDTKIHELDQWWTDEYEEAFQNFEKNGGPGNFITSYEYTQLRKQYLKKCDEILKSIPTQWQIGQEFQLKNLANIVEERVRVMDDVITSNANINSKLTKWEELNEQERLNVAQQILDDYATKLGTPKAQVFLDPNTKWGGYYLPGTGQIYLNPKAQFNSANRLTEILSHEYAHLVDDLDPNAGALGSQYSYYGSKIYSNKKSEGYRVALTEQSSYAIGNATGRIPEDSSITLDDAATYILGTAGAGTASVGIELEVYDRLTNKKKENK